MDSSCYKCNKNFDNAMLLTCEINCCREDSDDEDDNKHENTDSPLLFCKGCTDTCCVCDARGCGECVGTVCCDCGVSMCNDCRNEGNLCGCYGKCFWCRRKMNRGSDGWPCWECKRWGCYDCRVSFNDCKECNPNIELDEDEDEDEDEDADVKSE